MRIGAFSEFAYGHAVTKEVEDLLCTQYGETLIAAPDLPSLRRERSVGFDVRIDTDATVLALQFKLGEFVSQRNRSSPTWYQPGVAQPHYRIRFGADDDQLMVLRQLQQTLSSGSRSGIVFYIAPAFHESREFSTRYVTGRVIDGSYGCTPNDVPIDQADHHLVCAPTTPHLVLMCSDPTPIKAGGLSAAIANAVEDRRGMRERSTRSLGHDVPEAVLATEKVLRECAARTGSDAVDIDLIDNRASHVFRDRPDLKSASVAIEIGSALGIMIAFTAQVHSS